VIPQIMNNQKTVLMLVATIVLTTGILVTALTVVTPLAKAAACAGERDTKACPNKRLCIIRLEEGKKVTECTG
jgi:hypothetical protein